MFCFFFSKLAANNIVSSLSSLDALMISPAKVEKEEKAAREERPQPARKPRNQEVLRPVFSFLSVVSIVS
jgi:hypothetical protein